METPSTEPSYPGPSHAGPDDVEDAPLPGGVEIVDPERDIDARTTVIWVLAWVVVLIIAMWLMLVLFQAVLFQERQAKIEQVPAQELEQLVEGEQKILAGDWGDDVERKSIEEVMAERVQRLKR